MSDAKITSQHCDLYCMLLIQCSVAMSYEILRGEFMKVKLSQRYIYKNYD